MGLGLLDCGIGTCFDRGFRDMGLGDDLILDFDHTIRGLRLWRSDPAGDDGWLADRLHALGALRCVGFAVPFDELHPEPAEDVIDQALGKRDVPVGGHARGLEALVGELFDQAFERHAVLQRDRGRGA